MNKTPVYLKNGNGSEGRMVCRTRLSFYSLLEQIFLPPEPSQFFGYQLLSFALNRYIGLTLNANEEVPRLSPCPPPPMLSNFFGGKFKYLNRKNSEFLAGNFHANLTFSPEPNFFA